LTYNYLIKNKFTKKGNIILQLPAWFSNIKSVKLNGKPAKWTLKENRVLPLIEIECGNEENLKIEIKWKSAVPRHFNESDNPLNDECSLAKFTVINQEIVNQIRSGSYEMVNMDKVLNSAVTDIFENKYLSPRSPYTTLQTPWQGVGEWCHPLLTYEIDDSGLRQAVKEEVFTTSFGLPFRIPDGRNNIAFTTLWDNYPDSISVPLSGKAKNAVLLMAGTTNAMQYGVVNGRVEVVYNDGRSEELPLINPDTWCPIEQDFYTDDLAFKIQTPRPYRVAFKTGTVSRDMQTAMKIKPGEVYGRTIDGGAGIILNIPLDKNKELKSLQVKSIANEVVIGLMAVTLVGN
jgi:hypothetical protein